MQRGQQHSKEIKIINLVIDLGTWWLCQCGDETTEPEPPRVGQGLLETQGLRQSMINHRAVSKTVVMDAPAFVPRNGSISPLAFPCFIFG